MLEPFEPGRTGRPFFIVPDTFIRFCVLPRSYIDTTPLPYNTQQQTNNPTTGGCGALW